MSFVCNLCRKDFASKYSLNRHGKQHDTDGSYKCEDCNKEYIRKKDFEKHLRTHEEETTFECATCSKKFSKRPVLVRHIRLLHSISTVCDLCNKRFATVQSSILHRKRQHANNVFYKCDTCQKEYTRKKDLDNHEKTAHKEETIFECATCSRKFVNRRRIVRHIRLSHRNKHMCDLCDGRFTTRQSLNLHQKRWHTDRRKVGEETTFECPGCREKFSKRKEFEAHIRLSHGRLPDLFVCNWCQRNFATKYSLDRHQQHHKHGVPYECHLCSNKYTRKNKFDQHLVTVHGEEMKLECATCSKKFSTRRVLVRHIRASHSQLSRDFYECCHCSRKFYTKFNLIRHLKSCRSNPSNEKCRSNMNRYTCGVCNSVFDNKALVCTHYEDAHGIRLESESRVLRSAEEFAAWRSRIERETVIQFVKQRTRKSDSVQFDNYVCHRSSINRKCSRRRSRFPRLHGSKKLTTFCPAEIYVRIDKTDGTHHARYTSTHVGHPVEDSAELRHLKLTKEERLNVAARLTDGAPREAADENEWNNRLDRLRSVDRRDVAASFVIDETLGEGDQIDVAAFVENNKESVLYYKDQFMDDYRFGVLNAEDFVLVLMNKTQERYLRRYADDIVCFDGVCGATRDEFSLHTLLVFDVDRVGYPAAFFIANRNDQSAMEIFLHCIKERCGNVAANVLMSDMQGTYYNGWIAVMDERPAFHLYCTRHVNDAWRKRLPKKKDSPTVEEVRRRLNDLQQELDPVCFEEKLDEFLRIEAEGVEDFIEHFRENYTHNTHRWAYAHRLYAGINVNMVLESFHRQLKHLVTNGSDGEWLSQTLRLINQYLEIKDRKEELKRIFGNSESSKVRALRRAHREAEKNCEDENFDSLVEIDANTYYVQSFSDESRTYTVRKKDEPKACARYDDVVCGLPCQLCEICFHEYECSCMDMAIRSNMCKHIHTVGIYKQKHKVPVDAVVESLPIVICDVDASHEETIVKNDCTENTDERREKVVIKTKHDEQLENVVIEARPDEQLEMVVIEAKDLLSRTLDDAKHRGVDFIRKMTQHFIDSLSKTNVESVLETSMETKIKSFLDEI